MSAKHTPGPWRWEVNRKSKDIKLVGGHPQFDKTVMDFERWGMGGASPRFALHFGDAHIMTRLCDRPEWIKPFSGRLHHADWCAGAIHPDARLIEAAPELLEALEAIAPLIGSVLGRLRYSIPSDADILPAIAAAIAKAKGEA